MKNPEARGTSGFTLWELMVVIALVVILFATAIENLLPLRGAAERAAVLTTIGSLRSAVGMESIRRVMEDGPATLAAMAGANPVDWLLVPPATYAGVFDNGDARSIARGEWGFDSKNGVLFYRVRYPEYVDTEHAEPGIRFRVTVKRHADGELQAVEFEQLDNARWHTDGSELGRWMEQSP